MMTGLMRALLVVLCLTPCFARQQVTYNGSVCTPTAACSWDDPAIWNPHVPAADDDVVINATDATIMIAKTPDVVNVNSILLIGSHLVVSRPLVVVAIKAIKAQVDVKDGATVSYGANSTVIGNWTLDFDQDSELTVADNSSVNWNSRASFFGSITLNAGSYFFIYHALWSPTTATLNSDPSFYSLGIFKTFTFSTLNAHDVSVWSPYTLTVTKKFSGELECYGTAIFNGGSVDIIAPLFGLGSGVLTFTNNDHASITGTANYPTIFNGTLVVEGSLILQNITIYFLNTTENTLKTATITGNGLIWNILAPVTFPGALAAIGQGVTLQTTAEFKNEVQVTASQLTLNTNAALITPTLTAVNSTLNINGALHATLALDNTQLKLGGSVIGDLSIPLGSTFTATSPVQVWGNVTNDGILNIDTDNTLQIFNGNYVQEGNGTLTVVLHKTSPALTVVNCSIILKENCTLQFSITDQPFLKSAKFQVAVAGPQVNGSWTVNGTFHGDATPLSGSKINRNLGVKYEATAIYIQYDWKVNDVPVWMWVVLAVAVAVILIAAIAIIVKCRRRTGYEAVH